MTASLLLILKLSVIALIFAVGLSSSIATLTYLWRRPVLLVRSILAMYLFVPLVALTLVKILPLRPGVEIAILVLAVSAGAPLLPRKFMKFGSMEYAFSLVVTSTILTIIAVPIWLAIIGAEFGSGGELSPKDVALVIAKAFYVPLVAGMIIRRMSEKRAESAAEFILNSVGLVLSVCALALLVLNWNLVLLAGWMFIVTIAILTLATLAVGHMLGGPDENNRSVLATACATRHLAVAMLVAASVPGPRTAVLVASYMITSAVISIVYMKWRQRSLSVR
jgi:predicted Na+-dependent transporter